MVAQGPEIEHGKSTVWEIIPSTTLGESHHSDEKDGLYVD